MKKCFAYKPKEYHKCSILDKLYCERGTGYIGEDKRCSFYKTPIEYGKRKEDKV